MENSKVVDINDSSFDQDVLKSTVPTVLYLWAPWCAPCNNLSPIYEQIAIEYSNQLKFTKMNIDLNPATPEKYGILVVPYLLFFQNGDIVEQNKGICNREELMEKINNVIPQSF